MDKLREEFYWLYPHARSADFDQVKQIYTEQWWQQTWSVFQYITMRQATFELKNKPASNWIKVGTSVPEIEPGCSNSESVYFVSDGEVYHGCYGTSPGVCLDPQFLMYNGDYDGGEALIKNVTHWQYENVPDLPAEDEY